MFEQLLHFVSSKNNEGIIWSLDGVHYLAMELAPEGTYIRQSERAFKTLCQATAWLKGQGIHTISLRQSGFQMSRGANDETYH